MKCSQWVSPNVTIFAQFYTMQHYENQKSWVCQLKCIFRRMESTRHEFCTSPGIGNEFTHNSCLSPYKLWKVNGSFLEAGFNPQSQYSHHQKTSVWFLTVKVSGALILLQQVLLMINLMQRSPTMTPINAGLGYQSKTMQRDCKWRFP